MSDLYTEVIVKKERTAKDIAIKILLILGTVLSLFAFITGIFGILSLVLLAAFVAGDFFLFPSLDLEYEYLYVNGELDIDKIMSKQKRKRVFSGDVSNLEIMAPSNSHELDYCRNRQDIKKLDFSSGKKDQKTYTMVLKTEKGLQMVIFEPNEVIVKDMKRIAPREVSLY